MVNQISALFVKKNSIYKSMGIDSYDITRNALTHKNKNPVICHPPCRAWGKLKHMAKPRAGERKLTIWALLKINRNGGILEHPKGSRVWTDYRHLMKDGIILETNQLEFGHPTVKPTLLYIKGIRMAQVPAYKPINKPPTHYIGGAKKWKGKDLKSLHSTARETTPKNLAIWLIQIAEQINKNKTDQEPIKIGQVELF